LSFKNYLNTRSLRFNARTFVALEQLGQVKYSAQSARFETVCHESHCVDKIIIYLRLHTPESFIRRWRPYTALLLHTTL